jgi:hypothetical protein
MGRLRRAAFGRLALASVGAALGLAVACEPLPMDARDEHGPGGDTGLARALCSAACARTIRCEGPRAATCDCASARDEDLLRADWVRADVACLGQATCGASQDCETEAYRSIGAAPFAWPPVVMRCLARGDACGGSSATCRRLAALTDDARAEADACFEGPCEAYASCFQAFLASRVAPAVPPWR